MGYPAEFEIVHIWLTIDFCQLWARRLEFGTHLRFFWKGTPWASSWNHADPIPLVLTFFAAQKSRFRFFKNLVFEILKTRNVAFWPVKNASTNGMGSVWFHDEAQGVPFQKNLRCVQKIQNEANLNNFKLGRVTPSNCVRSRPPYSPPRRTTIGRILCQRKLASVSWLGRGRRKSRKPRFFEIFEKSKSDLFACGNFQHRQSESGLPPCYQRRSSQQQCQTT